MNYAFSVYRRTQGGKNTGLSDALLNVEESPTLTFTMQDRESENWVFKGAKFYWILPSTVRQQKDADIKTKLNSGQTSKYQALFGTSDTPEIQVGISSDGKTLTVTETSEASTKGYEYLLWIQNADDSSDNDYVDPGIRNRW